MFVSLITLKDFNPYRLKELHVQQLSANDFVCLDKEKDLTNMIDLHTSYKITIDDENGRQHRTTYNFEALEKQVCQEVTNVAC